MKTISISRRRFLEQAVGSAIATSGILSSSCGSMQFGGKSKRKILVGGSLLVYGLTQPEYDIYPILDRIFADMSYAGLDGIELTPYVLEYPDAVERIKALSDKNNLPVIGSYFIGAMREREYHEVVFEDARVVVTRLAKVGGRTLSTSGLKPPNTNTEAHLDAQAELLRRIMKLCDDNGVVLNLHTFTREVEDDMHDLRGMLARIPEAKLGPNLNFLVRGGVDPVKFIDTYGDRIVFLHIGDQNADGTWSEAVGEGDMDYVAIGRALKAVGFKGDAVIELIQESNFKSTRPLRDSFKMSRAYVRKTMGY